MSTLSSWGCSQLISLVGEKSVRQVWDNQTIIASNPNTNPKVKRACGPENEARFGDERNKTRGGSSMADVFSPHCCYFSALQDGS